MHGIACAGAVWMALIGNQRAAAGDIVKVVLAGIAATQQLDKPRFLGVLLVH